MSVEALGGDCSKALCVLSFVDKKVLREDVLGLDSIGRDGESVLFFGVIFWIIGFVA